MALLTEKRARKNLAAASDSSPEESDSEGSQSAGSEVEGNVGWADSFLKVLKTTKPEINKTLLGRAEKSQAKVRVQKTGGSKKPEFDFEIEKTTAKTENEEVSDDYDDVKPEVSALDAQLTKQQRKNVPLQLRVKPSYRDMERERSLRKVATQGTVQFFNAVRIQQKDLQQKLEDAGPLDSRQDAVLNNINKRKFLDVLMSGKRAKSTAIDNSVKKEESESDEDDEDEGSSATGKKKSEWSVLREDFMTNKKIKHWDEEDDDGTDQDGNDHGADDSDDDDGED